MRSGNLQSAAGRIQEALDDLQIAWQRIQESWNDERSEAFEENVLQRIADEVSIAVPAIGQMSQILNTAGRECDE